MSFRLGERVLESREVLIHWKCMNLVGLLLFSVFFVMCFRGLVIVRAYWQ